MFNQNTPASNSQNYVQPTIHRAIHALIRACLSVSLFLWPGPLPTQAGASERGGEQNLQESTSLELGKPIERELSGGVSHFYKITMTPGQFLRIVVKQQGIDVAAAISTPDGKKIAEVDIEHGDEPEAALAISESPGAYLIEVRSPEKSAKPGRYEIKVEELRIATDEDRYRVTGEALFQEARELENGTLEAKRKSIEKYHEVLDLYRRAGDRSREASTLNNIGEVYAFLGERQKALEKFNEALPIYRAVGDRSGEAVTLSNISSIYQLLGDMRKALEKFNESLPIFRAAGNRSGEAIALTSIGQVYRELGELQKALEKFNEALAILRAVGNRSSEAVALASIGTIYQQLGDMQKALEKYNEALPIYRAVGNRSGEAAAVSSIGQVYRELGDMQKALEKYNEALPIFRAVGDRMWEADTLSRIGSLYRSLGEMQKALEKFNEALAIKRVIGDRNLETVTLRDIGTLYWLLGDMQKALEKFDEALTISRAVGNRGIEATVLGDIGLVCHSLGEMQKALERYDEALTIFRAIGNRRWQAATVSNIGSLYRELGDMQKALERYDEALTIYRAVGDRNGEATTVSSIGSLYWLLGDIQKALEKYNEALPILRAVGNRMWEATTLLRIARVEQKRGNLTQARQTIEQATGMVESLRTNVPGQGLRASYFATRQSFFETYIAVLMEQHRQNPAAGINAVALAVSERARARSLLELLTEARADIRQGIDSALLERERSLRQRLNARATAQVNLLNRKHTQAQADAAAKEIASITTEYEELRAQIHASSPRYDALTQPQPLGLTEIQQQVLDPDTLLLEYSLGEDVSHLFVVSHTSITSYQLPKRAEIEAETRRVRELLTAPQPRPGETAAKRRDRIKEARANYWRQAAALSRMLLGPAASQLGANRLLIVTNGALQFLPFGALPVPETEGQRDRETGRRGDRENPQFATRNPQSYTPLMVEHEIVHLPSASTLGVLRRELAGRQPAAKAVAVLADPVFSADDARVKTGAKAQADKEAPSDLTRAISDVGGELRRLLMTRDEAENILSVTPRNGGFAALDFRANRATATSDELSNYRIVHFATHSLLNSEHPELSGLVLTLVDEQGRPQDGFLRMHEIFNLRLPAELVVLSACQTGLGKKLEGEGLVGLTRGFMYAGAARVVASLWEVNDAATAELMKRFYRRMLQDGMRPAAALRAAQIEMWKRPQWQSPFYWGGFILQGEWK